MMSAGQIAAQTRSFDIEAGNSRTTLREFARQARVDVVMDRRDVQGVQTNEVSGLLEPRIALERMLEGTPLVFKEDLESGAFAVTRSEASSPYRETQNTEPQILDETEMNPKKNNWLKTLAAVLTVGIASAPVDLTAQEDEDEVYDLSPFEVSEDEDIGYLATSTLAGSRLKTDLRDLGSAIQVVTKEFMEDTGSTDIKGILVYTTNTEVGGIDGNYSGTSTAGGQTTERRVLQNPSGSTRVRGLNTADLTREFFATDIPMDSYNTSRVDIQRGPNSILFGLGSPAGIINNSLIEPTLGPGGTELSFRGGRWGSLRSKIDIDKTLINGTLGVRIAALNEDQEFRQDPAFEEDKRIYFAGKWTPNLFEEGRTTIKLSYENGEIDANRPRTTPPKDLISPWFDPEMLNKQPYNPLTDTRNSVYHGWPGAWFEGVLGAVYSEHDSASLGGNGIPAFFVNGIPGVAMEGTAQQSLAGNFPEHAWNVRAGRNLAGFWKDQQISDVSIFDFRNTLLDGPNKAEWSDFDALNINLSQTFFNDLFGIELVYDEQSTERGGTSIFHSNAYGLEIDFNTHLVNGATNPNFGRPFLASPGYHGDLSFLDREAFRATAFLDIDFSDYMDSESWLTKILGRHRLTANYSDTSTDDEYRGFLNWALGPEIGVLGEINHEGANHQQKGSAIHYLGPRIDHLSSPAGANIPGITALHDPGQGDALLFVDGEFRTIPMSTLSYKEDIDQLWHVARKLRDEVESRVLVWQGWLLDGTVVPLVSWRKDEASAFSLPNGTAPRSPFNQLYLPDDPSWVISDTPDNVAEEDGWSYGLVLHSPESINRNLPYGTKVSFSYNESSNFRPAAGRKNFYGESHPFPSGDTKDYGITISTLEDKLYLKMNWYETSQNNDSVTVANWWFAGNIQAHSIPWAFQAPTASADIINEWFGLTGVDTGDPLTSALPRRAAWGDRLIWNLTPEETAFRKEWFSARTPAEWLAPFDQRLVESWNFRPAPWNPLAYQTTPPAGMTSLVNTVTEGFEMELVYNPLPNWRMALNVSKAEATQTDKGADLDEYIAANIDFWLDGWDRDNPPLAPEDIDGTGDMPIWNNRFSRTITSEALARVLIPYWTARNEDGKPVQELREWNANFISTYSFSDGPLQGAFFGGAVRYQDEVAIGNAVIEDPEVGFIFDVDDVFWGPSRTTFDLWIGYGKKILDDKVDWKIQLNVADIFGSDKLIPITTQPTGTAASYRIPNPNVWWVTNTFKF